MPPPNSPHDAVHWNEANSPRRGRDGHSGAGVPTRRRRCYSAPAASRCIYFIVRIRNERGTGDAGAVVTPRQLPKCIYKLYVPGMRRYAELTALVID
ncbi:hypothetical protein EVAR_38777_1 [Eumeta japonica]|uniref:Uncharacterized protein n=1 Tax=Eumeta variegata TaxID=151549 RepID=A0A4C1WK34_EUMVA|nr:hypothetical protein EVAR_38777_1 [Eumeta japonica]